MSPAMRPVQTLDTRIVSCCALLSTLPYLRAHLDDKFPRFVYHDGVFESLDDRKKRTSWRSFVATRSLAYSPS